ncbi:DUF551 domain-containing protein [Burkholderia cenocepacia]|uniref:DUF551 domain-containing protein n=1 Tax=Burkholderia cenocepacia TaxID=95486 RepID=UPI0024B71470|nr:DUF551 domain-containing protein [Burkholderia cenocepacia]MDI9680433.1 DUF551 domain-containing protein [Burkholderia cenocepacia]
MNDQQHNGAVRVCAIADIECSRGCGTGACKIEQPAAAPIDGTRERIAKALHYPGCWDTAAYPTLDAAMLESLNSFLCSACVDNLSAPAPAPAPAGERAALSEDRIDWIANAHCPGGTAHPVNVKNAIREALREARVSANETQTCSHQWTWADGKCADCGMIAQQPHAESGMTLAERIAHVGGRITEGGYVEFGSAMAVDALIQHVLRDARASANETGAEGATDSNGLISRPDLESDPLWQWRCIANEAEVVVNWKGKFLMLSEEMCVRLGSVLEDAARATAQAAQPVAVPAGAPALYFYGDHDRGFECPDDAAIVSGRKLGDRYTLNAAWYAPVLFEVTKVPDEESDDYEVRQVTAPQPPAQAVAREGLTDEQIIERCKAAGIKWIPPELPDHDDHEIGFPGSFDMADMDEMRALLAAHPGRPEPRAEVTGGWTKVDEKLPPYNRKIGSHGVEVLIWPAMESGERTAFFGRRISQKPMFYRYGAPVHGVTHWMPIPDAPIDAARAGGA